MPRPPKGPRLFLRERHGRAPVYVVLDTGGVEISTGCGPEERAGAEKALADYIGSKHVSTIGAHDPRAVITADVLTFYLREKQPRENADSRAKKSFLDASIIIERLIEWWGDKFLSEVRTSSCKDYTRYRTSQTNRRAKEGRGRKISIGTARRELEILRAAIRLYHAEHILDALPVVTLPEKADSGGRIRWLRRTEAAEALLACMGWRKGDDGRMSHIPEHIEGKKHAGGARRQIRARRAHLRRFVILGLYTGTRHMAMVRARWIESVSEPWIDVNRGLFYRRGGDERQTNKRQPPVRIPRRLLAHLRRWRDIDMNRVDEDGNSAPVTHVIHFGGKSLAGTIRTSWEGMRSDARLSDDVVPHALRHTSATWAMQGGMGLSDAADYLGMTEKVLRAHYYHFHPDFQSEADDAFERSKERSKAVRAMENGTRSAQETPKKPIVFPGPNENRRK